MVFVDFIVLNQMVKGFLRVDYLVAIIVGLVMYILGRNVFISHKTAQMTNHSQRLEEKIDKNRSSSNLTVKGKTNPKDK